MKNSLVPIALIVGALVLAGGGGYVVYSATRGLRNNNPGNIKYDGTQWQGLASPPSDGVFCRFVSATYGIRAMAIVLQNYVAVDGIPSTVTSIISRWAPPSIDDTVGYITDVDEQLGLTPGNDAIDLATQLPALIVAMIRHENDDIQPYSAATISQGISMAA